MRRKIKTRKKPIPPALLNQEQETLITILLQEIGNAEPAEIVAKVPDSRCAQVLIDRLPLNDEFPIPLLLALRAGFEDKGVLKAIKRALFKLKRRGVSTEEFYADESDSSTILKPSRKEPPRCYVGVVDGAGLRAVVIIVHRGGKGFDAGLGVVSDEQGIQEFVFSRSVSKGNANKMKEGFSKEAGPLVETSLSHAATLLEEAYQRHLALNSDVPPDYLELRPWLLENISPLERPAIKSLIHETHIPVAPLTDSQLRGLFDHELMESWVIEFDLLRPFMAEMFQARESPIVLTRAQQFARIREIQEKCIRRLFPARKRELLKHRLEEMGYVFFKLGQEETAGLALAAADTVGLEPTMLKANPVIETLLERSLAFYTRAMEERSTDQSPERGGSSSIILP
jgi:hypothetical protein